MFHVEHPPGVWMEKKENAILKYYGTATGFVLDRLQKDVLDSYEENNQKLFQMLHPAVSSHRNLL